ncbi:MAG: peptidylprolyl isomerase [Faecousia sp.]
MKKWVSLMLAIVLTLSVFTGCAGTQNQTAENKSIGSSAGIFYDITGIPPEKTVMTVSGVNISAEEYLYWMAYMGASLEYNIINYNAYYGMYEDLVNEDGKLNWSGEFQDGKSLAQYLKDETESTIAFYTAIDLMAQKYDVGLDEADKASIVNSLNAAISELGGQEEFDAYLRKLGISQETFEDLSASSYLFDNLLLLVLQEGTDLYLAPEKYNNYATYADHILFMTIDGDSGKPLSADLVAQQKVLAEQTLEAIRTAEDPIATFTELADKYSEDTGRANNPNGYIYKPNTMVESFEKAAAALEPGQISDIVESDYGYHIILRKDLLEALEDDPEQRVSLAETHLTTLLTLLAKDATIEILDDIKDLDVGKFYEDYAVAVEQVALENADAAAQKARAEAGIAEPTKAAE